VKAYFFFLFFTKLLYLLDKTQKEKDADDRVNMPKTKGGQ
jgi:hypothetical protein